MTILNAIRAAVEGGRLQEPFSAKDVAEALRDLHFSAGSIPASLAQYSRRRPNQPDPPLRRLAPGQYRLAFRTSASPACHARSEAAAHPSTEAGR
jgi:hypothetical protein